METTSRELLMILKGKDFGKNTTNRDPLKLSKLQITVTGSIQLQQILQLIDINSYLIIFNGIILFLKISQNYLLKLAI